MQQGSTEENNHLCAMFDLILDHMSMRWLNGQETMAGTWKLCKPSVRIIVQKASLTCMYVLCFVLLSQFWSFGLKLCELSELWISKSNSTGAQYVTLKNYNWMKKSENMPVWLTKMALAQNFCIVCELCQLYIRRESNSTGAQYVTLVIRIGWRKSKHAGLAQQNGFGPALLHSLWALWALHHEDHLHGCSVCDPVTYMEKSRSMPVWLSKMAVLHRLLRLLVKGTSKA